MVVLVVADPWNRLGYNPWPSSSSSGKMLLIYWVYPMIMVQRGREWSLEAKTGRGDH